jgi:hypothetical protein
VNADRLFELLFLFRGVRIDRRHDLGNPDVVINPRLEPCGLFAGLLRDFGLAGRFFEEVESRRESHHDRHDHAQEGDTHRDQGARAPPPEQVDDHAALGVQHQDVAGPEQVSMNQADHEQPQTAPVVEARQRRSTLFGPLAHEDQPGTEQHREEGHHLHVEEEVIEHPDDAICPLEATTTGRVFVGCGRPAEPDDVHGEDAQEGKAAQHVHRPDALVRCHGLQPGCRFFDGNRLGIEHRRNQRLGFVGHHSTSKISSRDKPIVFIVRSQDGFILPCLSLQGKIDLASFQRCSDVKSRATFIALPDGFGEPANRTL